MADNALTKLPLAGQLGVAVAAAAVIGGAFYFLVFQDMLADEQAKAAKLEELQKDIRQLEVTANKLGEFQREVQLLEAKLETLKRILPPEKETPDLMRKVQALVAQSNLSIRTFNPGAVVQREFYQEWPINIEVTGNFHNLALFFDRVSRLSRLVNVGGVRINADPNPTPSRTISAACTATTFVYVEPPPAPPQKK